MSSPATKQVTAETLANLQAAYNGESNARAKYTTFATKADEEGYFGVASLFRAAARAEEIHAENHARVIRQYGATPQTTIEPATVKTTADNLKAAIAGEEYERDVMYPNFLQQANKEGNSAARRTFDLALQAEAEHARLYHAALENLTNMHAKTDYFVCQVCGYTTADGDFARCTICNNPRERFDVVN